MTKALCSFPEWERKAIAERRARGETGGLGWLAARDYLARQKKSQKKAEEEEQNKKEGES